MPFKMINDKWLTENLGKYCFKLQFEGKHSNTDLSKLSELIEQYSRKEFLVYSKIFTDNITTINLLERVGFNLIDTNVQYKKKSSGLIKEQFNSENVRFSKPSDQESIVSLARESFFYSRFHIDPEISREDAKSIKAEWVKNYFHGSRGNYMVVSLVNETIAGFLLLLTNKENLVIDLIAVDAKFKRQGLALSMIQFANEKIPHKQYLVGTQIGNVPSIRLYEKMGFIFSGSEYVFHYHHTLNTRK